MTTTVPRTWRVFCQDFGPDASGARYRYFGTRRFVEMHGSQHPIVEADLVEDADGPFHGWLRPDSESIRMVQPRQLFKLQFPETWEAEAARGHGEAVPLRVELV